MSKLMDLAAMGWRRRVEVRAEIGEVWREGMGGALPHQEPAGRRARVELKLTATIYASDPDELEVARRMETHDLDSCGGGMDACGGRNEKTAEEFERDGWRVTAQGYCARRGPIASPRGRSQ